MDIDNFTIGDLKQIAIIAAKLGIGDAQAAPPHPFIGRYVICRCYSAGVHAGVLIALDGDKAILGDSRRLWYWKVRAGIALSGVAQHGITEGSKIDCLNPQIALNGVIEVIPCTDAARSSIHEYK
jgi:hypothetical protein